jgi:hypothetical protein
MTSRFRLGPMRETDGYLIGASTFRVSFQSFAVPPPNIPCFKTRKIAVRGLKTQEILGDFDI